MGLLDIQNDPDYLNANEATKRAIFDEYSKDGVIKYFKALATYIERIYAKFPKEDTNIINQLDSIKDLIYTTLYKLENLS